MSPYEIAGALFGALAVWLTARENVWCWPVGLLNVGLYVVVFYEARLYADMGLQVVYAVLCVYGWYAWLHGGVDKGALEVSHTPRRWRGPLLLLGSAAAGLLGFLLQRHTNASLPYWDSSTTASSLVAQWMQTRKWLENWLVWIVVDVVYVGIYLYKHLLPTAALYTVFLALAVMGFRGWRRSLARGRRPA